MTINMNTNMAPGNRKTAPAAGIFIAALIAATFLAACRQSPSSAGKTVDSAPPPHCAECDMAIREHRHEASAVVMTDGDKKAMSFDDIGCLLDHARFHAEDSMQEIRVRDAATGDWVAAESAHFILADTVHTPMGSGIEAFAAIDTARDKAKAEGVTPMSWTEINAAHTRWMEERYGPAKR